MTETSLDAAELPKQGCATCRAWKSPTHHDWTLSCSQCGKTFAYSGCSCDGCCGDGPYVAYGGGRTYYSV
jgi:hypothetical protein